MYTNKETCDSWKINWAGSANKALEGCSAKEDQRFRRGMLWETSRASRVQLPIKSLDACTPGSNSSFWGGELLKPSGNWEAELVLYKQWKNKTGWEMFGDVFNAFGSFATICFHLFNHQMCTLPKCSLFFHWRICIKYQFDWTDYLERLQCKKNTKEWTVSTLSKGLTNPLVTPQGLTLIQNALVNHGLEWPIWGNLRKLENGGL